MMTITVTCFNDAIIYRLMLVLSGEGQLKLNKAKKTDLI